MNDGVDVPLNYDWITARILCGSRPQSLADLQKLRGESVSHIIDVCMDDDAALTDQLAWADLGFTSYLWNPTPDDGKFKSRDWVLTSVRFALPALSAPGWIIYVHCHDGVNRGPSTAYAILRAQGLSIEQAKMLIRLARPIDWAGLRYADDVENALINGW